MAGFQVSINGRIWVSTEDLPVDVVELRVPVRMLSPLQRLAIRLQTVA